MLRHEPLVPGHVDEGEPLAAGQAHPGEAQVDGEAAAAFLGPAIGFHPGERAHQGRLPVVDVPGGRDDVHRGHGADGSAADPRR